MACYIWPCNLLLGAANLCAVSSQVVGASNPDLDRLQVSTDRESRKMLQGYAAQYSREISTLLLRIPHELLLLLKTNDCLRSVDNILVRGGGVGARGASTPGGQGVHISAASLKAMQRSGFGAGNNLAALLEMLCT